VTFRPYPKPPDTLFQFAARFATNEACAQYLFEVRYPNGYVCSKCGSTRAWMVAEQPGMAICENKHKVSVTAGTALHGTKIALQTWFLGAWLVATHKSGISAVAFQRQLGLSRLETAWTLLHKLRGALYAPEREQLNSACTDPAHSKHWIEIDQIEVGGEQERAARAAHGSNKAIVLVGVEVHMWYGQIHRDDAAGQESKRTAAPAWHTRAGRVRMRVVPTHGTKDALQFLRDDVAPGSEIRTDAHGSFNLANAFGYRHEFTVAKTDANPLPTLGRVTTNLKRWLMGTHKGAVQPQHLQAYLNEYAFRFNRRMTPWFAFNRALGLAALERPAVQYEGLYKVTAPPTPSSASARPPTHSDPEVSHAIHDPVDRKLHPA